MVMQSAGSEGQPRPVVEDDPDLQPSGKVVGIYERRSNSVMVGFIRSGRRDGGFREDDRSVCVCWRSFLLPWSALSLPP